MKKLFLIFFLVLVVSVPLLASAALTPIVQCGNQITTPPNPYSNPCTLADFFQMLLRVYKFMVYVIALPVAGILIVIGGILILLSGANQNWLSKGKTILWGTAIALAIIFGSWLIVNTTLLVIGYRPPGGGSWWSI